jgi:hypothetical protein
MHRTPRATAPPVRYGIEGPQAIAVPSREVLLTPDPWQPRKWRQAVRLPAGTLIPAVGTIPGFDPGHTFVVNEDVPAGGPITLYCNNDIPKLQAELQKAEGNCHIYYHRSHMLYLDSKPCSGRTKRWMAAHHQVGGLINTSLQANAQFHEVGESCVVVAHPNPILAGTPVAINYAP